MEQLLFESDKKECDKISNEDNPFSVFYFACSYKNNQMQKFIVWLFINDWKFWDHAAKPPLLYRKPPSIESHMVKKTVSELFEIFIKETSNK